LLRLLRWAGRIKQDITLWADTLGSGLAQELDYQQVSASMVYSIELGLCLDLWLQQHRADLRVAFWLLLTWPAQHNKAVPQHCRQRFCLCAAAGGAQS
jgi:hypothetical protein